MEVTRWRLAITVALGGILAVAAGGAFDAVQWPLFLPVVAVGIAALMASRQQLLMRAAVAVVAIAAGTAGAVVAAGGSLSDSTRALVRGPRQLLTTEWPSPAVPSVIGAVALLLAVTTALAADLAARRRWHLAPLAPIATGWAVTLAIGAPVTTDVWLLVFGGALAVLLALVRHDAGGGRLSRLVVADRTIIVSVVAIAVAAVGTATAVAWADRADPRRTQDADVNAAIIDPIEAMVALRRADPEFDLFSITDRSRLVGQSLPARWRIAALDTYDGQRWVPRLTLRPIGGRLGIAEPASVDRPPPIDYRLEYLSDDLDLLPFPGPPLAASIDVETDVDRVVVRALERPTVGLTISIESEVALTSRASLTTAASPRQVDELATGFAEQAGRMAGDGTLPEQLRRIEATMRDDWQLDPATPGGGQQLALIERFIVDTNRGTREQFVTAYVLLVRSLGFDARVATGFIVPPESLSSPLVLDSTMASVWPEVRFDDAGWIAFDPVPALAAPNDDEPPPQPEAQTPAAAQPPIAPPTDDVDDVEDEVVEIDVGTDRWGTVRRWVGRGGTALGLGVLPILIGIGSIVGLKWRRRLRRIRHADPAMRIRGAWANATDSLVDAGLAIAPSWTDDGIAENGAALAPTVPHELRRLAAMSTQMTFGSTQRASALADDAVFTSGSVDQAIRSDRTRWERLRWRLSLRSLRSRTRSPVAADVSR